MSGHSELGLQERIGKLWEAEKKPTEELLVHFYVHLKTLREKQAFYLVTHVCKTPPFK
jgi:hypothetical protein